MVYELANPKAPRDEWQRKPLANAYIAISWTIITPGLGHATTSCLHMEIARSNEKGEYVMEGPSFLTSAAARTGLMAHAQGMERVDWPFAERPAALKEIWMAKSTRSADERLAFLMLFDSPGCSGREMHDPQGVLRAYQEALAAEAKALTPLTQAGRNAQSVLVARVKPPPGPMRIEAAPVDQRVLMQRDVPQAAQPSSR